MPRFATGSGTDCLRQKTCKAHLQPWTCQPVRTLLVRSLFFFSSRRRHTRCSRDWSSDVCSSDLIRQLNLSTLEVFGPMFLETRTEMRQDLLPKRSAVRDLVNEQFRRVWPQACGELDWKRGGEGKRVELGGCRILKKKKK